MFLKHEPNITLRKSKLLRPGNLLGPRFFMKPKLIISSMRMYNSKREDARLN